MLAICLKNGKKEEQVETFEPNAEGVTINSIIEKMQKLFNSIVIFFGYFAIKYNFFFVIVF